MVLHRTNSPDVFKLSQYLPEPLADLTSRVKLEFHRFKNPVANELRTLHVVAKNTPSIRVNVFRIAALQFYRSRLESNKGIDDDDLCSLDLGGLVPNATRDLDFSHLGPLAIHDVEISLTDELLFPGDPDGAKRGGGLWIVELVGKSKRIRCVIRRGGTLGYMRRLTAGGVVLAIVGGDGRRLRDPEARVWLSGRVYQPDDHGDFALPFSREAEATTVLLIVPSRGLVVPREFDPPQEHYSLEAKFILNREALVHGNKVPVLVRSSIMLDDEKEVGLAVVDDSSLNVTFIDGQGLKTTRTVDGFLKGGYELGADRTFDFIVPPDCELKDFSPASFTYDCLLRFSSAHYRFQSTSQSPRYFGESDRDPDIFRIT